MIVIVLFFLISYFQKYQCGTILSYDMKNEWQNAGYLSKIIFKFALENSIQDTEFIRIASPIELGTVTARIRSPLISTLSVTKSFYNYYITGFSYSARVIYDLELTISLIPITGGVKGVFKVYTQSVASADSQVYDLNEIFGTFAVAPLPASTLKVVNIATTSSSSDSTKAKPNSEYELNVDLNTKITIAPFKDYNASSKIIANLTNTAYTITSCKFGSNPCPSGSNTSTCIPITIPTIASCSINSFGFTINLDSLVQSNQTLRLIIGIKNPGIVSTTNLELLHTSKENMIIFETAQSVLLAFVDKIDVIVLSVKFLWGITGKKACPVGIYQPIGIGSSNTPVVNNILIEFRPSMSISGQEFGLSLALGSSSRIPAILEGSIYWIGLLPAPNSIITCSSNFPQISLDTGIICRGIGNFDSSSTYSLGVRVYGNVYNPATASTDKSEGGSYPKLTLYSVNSTGSTVLSNQGSGPGFNYYLNSNLIPTKSNNLFTYGDSDGNKVFGSNWALAYRTSSTADSPMVEASLSDVLAALCLTTSGGNVVIYPSETANNCSSQYRYGVFKESNIDIQANRMIFFINPSEFSATNAWDATVYPDAELLPRTHIVHKIITHRSFLLSNSKKFGINVIGGLFTNLPNVGTGGSPSTCGKTLTNSRYCYPIYDNSDISFENGKFILDDSGTNLYLFNKYNDSAPDHLVITITCVIKTSADGSCAFKTSSRLNAQTTFPGLELRNTNVTFAGFGVSSLYPDEYVRDILFCSYLLPIADVGVNGIAIETLDESKAIGNVKLKLQGLLNWYSIDVPANSSIIASAAYFINNICIENSANSNVFSYNDGNHIPLLFRINYKVATNSSDAVGLFFSTKSNLASTPTVKQEGFFGKALGRPNTVDLLPHSLSSSFYTLQSSSRVGGGNKVGVQGFGVAGVGSILPVNQFTWNYHPFFLINDGTSQLDMYVELKHPIFANSNSICSDFYKLNKLVIAFLNFKPGSTSFYNVREAYVVYTTLKYSGGTYYSSKYSLNLGILFTKMSAYSGAASSFDSSSLFNPNSCQSTSTKFPISNDLLIGTTTKLVYSTKTAATVGCKEINNLNSQNYGTAITISSLYSSIFFKTVSESTAEFKVNDCVPLTISSSLKFQSNSLINSIFICPIQPATIDMSLTPSSLSLELNSPVPWFWGVTLDASPVSILKEMMTVGWSMNGQLRFAMGQLYASGQPSSALGTSASCITEPLDSIFISTVSQKIFWTLRSLLSEIVIPQPLLVASQIVSFTSQSIQLEDTLPQNLIDGLELHGCSSSPFPFDCSVSADAPNAKHKYELTPKSSTSIRITNDVNTRITINLFASFASSSFTANSKHVTKVYFLKDKADVVAGKAGMKVMDCGTSGSDVIIKPTARPNSLTINTLSFSKSKSVVSPFFITFTFPAGVGFWTSPSSSSILNVITIALGSMWNSAGMEDNVRCQVLKADGSLSHSIGSIKYTTAAFVITPSAWNDNVGTLNFKCTGGLSPATDTTNVTITVTTAKGTIATATAKVTSLLITPPIKSKTPSVITKYYTSGFGSIWNVSITMESPIKGGNLLFFNFPTSFLPWINFQGHPFCTINSEIILCDVFDIYTLQLAPENEIKANTTFYVVIYGIVTPSAYTSFSDIEIQLDSNTNSLDGVIEIMRLNAPPIYSIGSTTSIIHLLDYQVPLSIIRSSSNHTFYIGLSPSQITPSSTIYMSFTEEFQAAFIPDVVFVSCEVFQEFVPNATNLASSCFKDGDLYFRIKLISNFKTLLSPGVFRVSIGALFTPQYESQLYFIPQIYIVDATENQILGFTSPSYRNASSINYVVPESKINVQFYETTGARNVASGYVTMFRGYFGTSMILGYPNGTTSTGSIQRVKDESLVAVRIYQPLNHEVQSITIKSSESQAEFYVGILPNFTFGSIKFKTSRVLKDERILLVPYLDFEILSTPCTIETVTPMTSLPVSTSSATVSFQISFNFTLCLPIDNVSIAAKIDNSTNVENLFALDVENQTLVNTHDEYNRFLFFFVGAKAGTPSAKSVTINFEFGGANGESYVFTKSSLTFLTEPLIVANAAPGQPLITTLPGEVEIQYDCKEPANLFYVFGIRITIVQQGTIEELTMKKKVSETVVDLTSSSLKKYGWATQQGSNSKAVIKSVGDLKTSANYTIFAFCKNLQNTASNVITSNWVQASSGAEYGKIIVQLSNTPNDTEKVLIMNVICLKIQARLGSVTDFLGNKCNNIVTGRILQLTNASSDTSNTSNTSNASNLTNSSSSSNTTNSTSSSNTTNSTNSTNATDSTNTTNTTNTTNVTVPIFPFNYTIYFHPNTFLKSSETRWKLGPILIANLTKSISPSPSLYQMKNLNVTYFPLPSRAPLSDSSITRIDTTLTSFNSTLLKLKVDLGFYFFAGVGLGSSNTPSVNRLLLGQDGDGKSLLATYLYKFYEGNITHEIVFGSLNSNTEYKVYFMLSSENIGSSETLYSQIVGFPFTTKITSQGARLTFLLLILLISIFY